MAAQWKVPGGPYLQETTASDWKAPGGPYVNETVPAVLPVSKFVRQAVNRASTY